MKTIRILTVCTSNKDRSPALANAMYAFEKVSARSVGINRHKTQKYKTSLICAEDIKTSDLIVCVSKTHVAFINGMCHAAGIEPPPMININLTGFDYSKDRDRLLSEIKIRMLSIGVAIIRVWSKQQ